MSSCEKLPTTINPGIQSFHADSRISRDQLPRDAEDLYREYLERHPATLSHGVGSGKLTGAARIIR